jgi:peroxiredoxin
MAALAAGTMLVSQTHAQVAEDAKKVLEESAAAMQKTQSMTYKSKKSGTGMLKDIIDADGTITFWRPAAGDYMYMVDGRVKQPGKQDKKQMSVHTPKTVTWLNWETNTMFQRPATDTSAISESNIAKQLFLEEFISTTPFEREIKMGKLSKKGVDQVNGEVCDIIEATPMDESRNFTWAISVKDRLPRRLEIGTGKAQQRIAMITEITDVTVGAPMSAKNFEIAMPTGFVKDFKVAEAVPAPAPAPAATPAPAPVDIGLKPGTPAPAFTLKTVDGKSMTNADMKGNVAVMEFWGTIFKQATAHSAEMQALADDFKGQKVNFVGLACRELNPTAAQGYWTANKMSYPLVADGNQVANDFKVSGFPSYVVIGPDGNVAAFFQSFPGKDQMRAAVTAAMPK